MNTLKNFFIGEIKYSKEIFLVLFSIFMYAVSYSSIALLPIYLKHDLHYTVSQSGNILSIFGIGAIIASYYGGKLCDKFSSYSVASLSLFLYILILIINFLIPKKNWIVIISLFLLGISSFAYSPASRIYLMNITRHNLQAEVNGIRYMLFNIGTAISFGVAGLIIQGNYKNIFLFAAFTCLLSMLFLYTSKKNKVNTRLTNVKVLVSHYKSSNLMFIILSCYFLGMIVLTQLNSSYTLFLSEHNQLRPSKIAYLFLINSIVIAVSQMYILRIIKNISQFFIMSLGCLIIGLGFFILIFGDTYFIAIASIVLITIGEMLFMPISQNLVYQTAKPETKGYYMGIYQALYASTLVFTPMLSSIVLEHDSNGLILWSISLTICIIPLLCFLFVTYKNQNKFDTQTNNSLDRINNEL